MLRRSRDFIAADSVRDTLALEFSVTVHDREQEWFVGESFTRQTYKTGAAPRQRPDFGELGHDYSRSPEDAHPLAADDFEPINGLLASRLEAKMRRAWGEADQFKAQLAELGVAVDDERKMWRADGADFPRAAWMRIAGDGDDTANDASERGEGGAEGAVPFDDEQVLSLISQRGDAKRDKEYGTADALCAQLRNDFGVVLDDKRRTWRRVVEFGGYYRVGPQVDPFLTKQVGDLLERRTAHQTEQEYDAADAIHAELSDMGIVLDTRLKTWKRPVGR